LKFGPLGLKKWMARMKFQHQPQCNVRDEESFAAISKDLIAVWPREIKFAAFFTTGGTSPDNLVAVPGIEPGFSG
jgi:hypothetical protein